MRKKISEMTSADKAAFLESTKKSLLKEHGTPWETIEQKILSDIDQTFDDEKFAKMDPDFAIEAAYARRYFGKKKPNLVYYLLWTGSFVTNSEYVEW